MNKKLIIFLAGIMIVIYSCSKVVVSRPQFIFKAAPKKGLVAKINGKEITEAELEKSIESDIYQAENKVFEIKMNRFKALLLKEFMNSDPRKKNLTNDQYMDKYISSLAKVSKMEIKEFIKKRKIPKANLTEALNERIKQFLLTGKKKTAVDTWMTKKLQENKVEVYIKKPKRPVFDVNIKGEPFKGNTNAKVTVVEFSDFQCPYCARGRTLMEQLRRKYGKKIKIVYKNFPLAFHNHAQKAAEAASCAFNQGSNKFWALHDIMFDDQTKLDVASIKKSAKKIGMKMKVFNNCLDSSKMAASVNKSIADGQNAAVKSTPTYFVNGQMINGAQDISIFSELIDQQLAK